MISHYYNSSFQTKTRSLLFNEEAYLGDGYIKKEHRELLWSPLTMYNSSRLSPGHLWLPS